MAAPKRTRLYFGTLLLAAGIGATLLGLRAERFVENRQSDIREAHARRRAELEQLAIDSTDGVGRMLLAEHDGVTVPRALERYRFGMQVAKSMQYGGLTVALVGVGLLASYVLRRRHHTAGVSISDEHR